VIKKLIEKTEKELMTMVELAKGVLRYQPHTMEYEEDEKGISLNNIESTIDDSFSSPFIQLTKEYEKQFPVVAQNNPHRRTQSLDTVGQNRKIEKKKMKTT